MTRQEHKGCCYCFMHELLLEVPSEPGHALGKIVPKTNIEREIG